MADWTYNIWFQKKKHFWEKKFVAGDLDGRIQANVWIKTGDCLMQESCSCMEASIQNLIQSSQL